MSKARRFRVVISVAGQDEVVFITEAENAEDAQNIAIRSLRVSYVMDVEEL